MARRVEWADRALAHLELLAAFIAQDSPSHAALTVSRIVARIEQAAQFPESGRVVPEYSDAKLRELFWREYRIIYRAEEDRIVVVAVVHGRRRLTDEVLPEE